MRKTILAISTLLVLVSCKSSKDYLSRSTEDKTLYDIVKQLNKKPTDELAVKALPEVYAQLKTIHLDRIASYKTYTETTRWNKVLTEYETLQGMYNAIVNSDAASGLITASNYKEEIAQTKQSAAEEYYAAGIAYLEKNNRLDARNAYAAFKKADGWVKGYKDIRAKLDTAKELSIINVVINPVEDKSYFFNTGWSSTSLEFNSNNLPQSLVRDLDGTNASRYPARFYTDRQAERANITDGWVADLTLREVNIPAPTIYNYTRKVDKRIEIGKDTAGKPISQTVYATLHIRRQSFTATARVDLNISEPSVQKNILFDRFSDTYNWEEETGSYSGDNRALSNSDWEIINNRYAMPTKEDVLNELYRGIYPQIKNKLSNAVDW